MTVTHISFVRHGHVHNPDHIYYGRLPNFRLSSAGRQQAARAAEHLAQHEITAVYHSPLLRTTQTAEIISRHLDSSPVTIPNDHLLEVYTEHDGITMDELAARNYDLYTGAAAEYEQPHHILSRVQAFVTRTLHDHAGEHVAAVSHGDVIAFTLLWAMGHPPQVELRGNFLDYGLTDPYPETASVSTFTFESAPPEIPSGYQYMRPYPLPDKHK